MKKIAILTIASALLAFLLGCSLTPSASDTGSLVLSFAQYGVKGAKDFLPPVDMNIASWDVQGSGPGGATFSQSGVTSSTLTVSSLATGNWTISVDAWNGANPSQKIAWGSVGVAISGGQTASATVTCTPLSGTGTLALSVSWLAGIIVSPSISATLAPQGGSPAAFPLALAVDGLSASGSDPACAAGYHTLSIVIMDAAQQVYGQTDTVRIIAGSTTTATITLTAAVAAPSFSPAGGTYSADQQVTLGCATAGAAIHYTTDGFTTPTSASPVYSSPIAVSGAGTTLTIRAIGVKAGMIDSPVVSATYTITTYTVNIATKAIVGDYLVDGRGMTLYWTSSDAPNYSNLPDETLTSWPVFYVSNIQVPPSLNASDFGTYTRDNGMPQTTYKGYPLYYSFLDTAPGDTLGNNLGNWFVVVP